MLAVLLAISMAVGPAMAPEQARRGAGADGWTRWGGAPQRLTIMVPPDWEAEAFDPGTVVVAEDSSRAVFAFVALEAGRPGETPEAVAQRVLDDMRQDLGALRIGPRRIETSASSRYSCGVAYRRGASFLGRLTAQGAPQGHVGLYYFQADAERFTELRPILERILSSCTRWTEGTR